MVRQRNYRPRRKPSLEGETLKQRRRQMHLSLLLNKLTRVVMYRRLRCSSRSHDHFNAFEFTRMADFVTGGRRVSYGWLG